MTRKSAYRLLDRPGAGSFAAAWGKALGWGQDRTLDRSLERSLLGEIVPIVRDGHVVGERHRYDNRLSFAVLKALDRRAESRLGQADPAAVFRAAVDELAREGKLTPSEHKGFSRPT